MFTRPDLVLIHPPSVFDFRKMLVVPSPVADLIPSSQMFDMYPLGFSFLGEFLERHGFSTRIINLAAVMMTHSRFDVEKALARLRPAVFGVDLHWLPSCHGALEVSKLLKRLHPDIPVVLGGYSASFFHGELVHHPGVDFVIRGDSAEEPLLALLRSLNEGSGLDRVPNLTYTDKNTGRVVVNPLRYVPEKLDHLGDNYAYMIRSAVRHGVFRGLKAFSDWWSYPLTAVLTCRGCLYDCTFCGGSKWSMDRFFCRRRPAFRNPADIARDINTVSSFTGAPIFVIGDLRQNGEGYASEVLDAVRGVAPPNHVVLELFEPAPARYFEEVARSLPNFDFEISPESHDVEIRRMAGKKYSNQALEEALRSALEHGCGKFDVFFMIGLAGQTRESVTQTVSYCEYLLERFGKRVNPLIGPLAPFLDPGSAARENPAEAGYRLVFDSLEEFRSALVRPNWRDTLSYETELMSRQDIVDATYSAILELNLIKRRRGVIPPGLAECIDRFIKDNMSLLERVDRYPAMPDGPLKEAELSNLEKEAGRLLINAPILKEELKWPVVGRKFHYFNIIRMVLGRDGVRRRPAAGHQSG